MLALWYRPDRSAASVRKKLPSRPLHKLVPFPYAKGNPRKFDKGVFTDMKATGIVRRIDDLGRVVIPKEIRRVLRIREGDPLLMTSTVLERYIRAIRAVERRVRGQ